MTGAVALWVLGCVADPAILAAFEAEKAAALVPATALAADWSPDAVVHLSPEAVNRAMALGLRQVKPVERRIALGGGVTVVPKFQVRTAQIVGEGDCGALKTTCVRIDVALGGMLGFESTLLGKGEGPVAATATLEVALATEAAGKNTVHVTADPVAVKRIDLGLTRLPRGIAGLVEEQVRTYVEAFLVEREPLVVAQVGQRDLAAGGARAFRVEPDDTGLRVALRTDAAAAGTIRPRSMRGNEDWQLEVSQASLLSIARREAFARRPLEPGIVPVPQSLKMKGDTFELGLRVWRVSGRPWWRDYTITGTVAVMGDRILLTATDVVEGERSAGARSADPLAALAEGVILNKIAEAAQASVPTGMRTAGAGVVADVAVTRVVGRGDVLVVAGSLGLDVPE